MLLYLFLQRPIIGLCTTLPILGYHFTITVTFMNGSQKSYTSYFINDILDYDDMGNFTFNYSKLFNEPLEPNSVYNLNVLPINLPGKLFVVCTVYLP